MAGEVAYLHHQLARAERAEGNLHENATVSPGLAENENVRTSGIDVAAELPEALPDPVIGCDVDGTVVYWSRAAEEVYGHHAEEALGRRAATLLHTRFPVPLLEIIEELEDRGRWRGRLEHRCKDGRACRWTAAGWRAGTRTARMWAASPSRAWRTGMVHCTAEVRSAIRVAQRRGTAPQRSPPGPGTCAPGPGVGRQCPP